MIKSCRQCGYNQWWSATYNCDPRRLCQISFLTVAKLRNQSNCTRIEEGQINYGTCGQWNFSNTDNWDMVLAGKWFQLEAITLREFYNSQEKKMHVFPDLWLPGFIRTHKILYVIWKWKWNCIKEQKRLMSRSERMEWGKGGQYAQCTMCTSMKLSSYNTVSHTYNGFIEWNLK